MNRNWYQEILKKLPTSGDCKTTLAVLTPILTFSIGVMIGWLLVRAGSRLEVRWDNIAYHLPFAAMRAGITTSLLELNQNLQGCFEGFPPLPEIVQGILWRLSGDIRATSLANFLAFLIFMFFCATVLEASLWLVALLSLAAPLVLIHISSGYVDLFANVWISIGFAAIAKMAVDGSWQNRRILYWCAGGIILAGWSKYQMVPLVALITVFLTVIFWSKGFLKREERIHYTTIIWGAAVLAAAPYLKNWLYYGNPFWPLQVRAFGRDIFPFIINTQEIAARERPPPFINASQAEVFIRSLLEIGHPTSYPDRERWIIDQGNANVSFRSGGLWAPLMAVEFLAIAAMSVLLNPRRGLFLLLGVSATLAFVSILPQSHELRYYMFIALAGAAITATLFQSFSFIYPRCALFLALLFLGMGVHVFYVNQRYFSVESVGYLDVARYYGADSIWPRLKKDVTYCTLHMGPIPLLLTGPSMNDFRIIDRLTAESCPPNTVTIKGPY